MFRTIHYNQHTNENRPLDTLESTYSWFLLSFMFMALRNQGPHSFQQQTVILMLRIEQLVFRRRNYKTNTVTCNSFFVFLGARVWVLISIYQYQNPTRHVAETHIQNPVKHLRWHL